jgi:hypothetical protein
MTLFHLLMHWMRWEDDNEWRVDEDREDDHNMFGGISVAHLWSAGPCAQPFFGVIFVHLNKRDYVRKYDS